METHVDSRGMFAIVHNQNCQKYIPLRGGDWGLGSQDHWQGQARPPDGVWLKTSLGTCSWRNHDYNGPWDQQEKDKQLQKV